MPQQSQVDKSVRAPQLAGDNTDQPFDINEGSKLELGSTAKLRVLTTYLQIIAELHDKYAAQPTAELKKNQRRRSGPFESLGA